MTLDRGWRGRLLWAGAGARAPAPSLALYGYSFGIHNHSIQIPFLRWLQDPTLFPGDRCMEAMRGYFSFFWPLMARLTRWLPLGPTFLVGHVLAVAATFAAGRAVGGGGGRESPR